MIPLWFPWKLFDIFLFVSMSQTCGCSCCCLLPLPFFLQDTQKMKERSGNQFDCKFLLFFPISTYLCSTFLCSPVSLSFPQYAIVLLKFHFHQVACQLVLWKNEQTKYHNKWLDSMLLWWVLAPLCSWPLLFYQYAILLCWPFTFLNFSNTHGTILTWVWASTDVLASAQNVTNTLSQSSTS